MRPAEGGASAGTPGDARESAVESRHLQGDITSQLLREAQARHPISDMHTPPEPAAAARHHEIATARRAVPATDGRRGRHPGEMLTAREREVVLRVVHGDSNAEIAARLWLSPRTVQSHIASASRKLHARNRTHLAVLSIAWKIAPLPDLPAPSDG